MHAAHELKSFFRKPRFRKKYFSAAYSIHVPGGLGPAVEAQEAVLLRLVADGGEQLLPQSLPVESPERNLLLGVEAGLETAVSCEAQPVTPGAEAVAEGADQP